MNRFFLLLAILTLTLSFSMIPVYAKSDLRPHHNARTVPGSRSDDKPTRAHTLSAEARDRLSIPMAKPIYAREETKAVPLLKPKVRLESDIEDHADSLMGDTEIEALPHLPTRSAGLTNAERMKRGLPLKMPSRLYTPSRAGAIRPRAS